MAVSTKANHVIKLTSKEQFSNLDKRMTEWYEEFKKNKPKNIITDPKKSKADYLLNLIKDRRMFCIYDIPHIMQYRTKYGIYFTSTYIHLSNKTIDNNIKDVNWYVISYGYPLTRSFVNKYKEYLDFDIISLRDDLNVDFIRDNVKKLNWRILSINHIMDDEFINEFNKYIDWDMVSKYQKLSLETIKKYKKKFTNMTEILAKLDVDEVLQSGLYKAVEPYEYLSIIKKGRYK